MKRGVAGGAAAMPSSPRRCRRSEVLTADRNITSPSATAAGHPPLPHLPLLSFQARYDEFVAIRSRLTSSLICSY
ncbi:unnamed protein product [Caenorhabditis auriculariae]|uniref:Uncharacterized protein n=1 Tax=Caenorhabditis auriculariae TaxID=2777116 RepID=A0A8S1GQE1_9PELO|nr:unnamed protein product [Caenorhabditis auriculariae]